MSAKELYHGKRGPGPAPDNFRRTSLGWRKQDATHDVATITAHAYRCVMKGDSMPGVFEVSRRVPVRAAVKDILLITECSTPGEWEGSRVVYLYEAGDGNVSSGRRLFTGSLFDSSIWERQFEDDTTDIGSERTMNFSGWPAGIMSGL